MSRPQIQGRLRGDGRRFGIVAARFNSRIVDLLVDGAVDCLERHGSEDVQVVRVPGAWEVPSALDAMARQGGYDALVAIAVVIRGETPHFDFISSQCTAGVARVEAEHHLPVGFGILTCDTSEQAQERAGGKVGNKGWEAAHAALEMADLFHQLQGN